MKTNNFAQMLSAWKSILRCVTKSKIFLCVRFVDFKKTMRGLQRCTSSSRTSTLVNQSFLLMRKLPPQPWPGIEQRLPIKQVSKLRRAGKSPLRTWKALLLAPDSSLKHSSTARRPLSRLTRQVRTSLWEEENDTLLIEKRLDIWIKNHKTLTIY